MRTGSLVQTRQGRATVLGPDPDLPGRYYVKLGTGDVLPVDPQQDPTSARPIIGHAWATDLQNGLICTWPDRDAVMQKASEQSLTVLQIVPTKITAEHVGRTVVVLCDEHGTPVVGAGT